MRLRSVPGGWAECGGMYKYKLRGFWYVLKLSVGRVEAVETRVICKSRKMVDVVRSSKIHFSFPKEFMSF